MRVFLALALTLIAVAPAAAQSVRGAGLDDAFRDHVRALQTRDLAALERTITRDERLEMIFPDGRRSSTRAEYLAFHREWFARPDWTITFRPVGRVERADLALITARVRYEERTGRRLTGWSDDWVTLTFARERDGWRLAQEQNTRIRSGPSSPGG